MNNGIGGYPTGSGYENFVPVFSQDVVLTVTSLVSKYVEIDKFVHFYGWAQFTSAGTASNGIGLTLPMVPNNSGALGGYFPIGTGIIDDDGSTNYRVIAIQGGPGIVFYDTDGTAGAVQVGVTPALTIASGDKIWWNVNYEAR
jgi:hypothetical protein